MNTTLMIYKSPKKKVSEHICLETFGILGGASLIRTGDLRIMIPSL